MTVKITLERANQLAFEQGGFISLTTLLREYGVSLKTEAKILSRFFEMLLPQVNEAQKEVTHIHGALTRMEHTCRQGLHIRPRNYGERESPLIEQFQRDLWPLDGWVVSLLETDLSLVGFVSPEMARRKMLELSRSMNTLSQRRQTDLSPFLKDPGLFADYFKV